MLECKRCKADLSPVNPSETNRRHKCTTAALAAAEGEGTTARSMPGRSRRWKRSTALASGPEARCAGVEN